MLPNPFSLAYHNRSFDNYRQTTLIFEGELAIGEVLEGIVVVTSVASPGGIEQPLVLPALGFGNTVIVRAA